MKINILSYIIVPLAVIAAGCTKEIVSDEMPDGQGSLQITFSLPGYDTKSAADGTYEPLAFSTLRIYKVERDAEDVTTENLIRKYKPATEVPSQLYLAAGEYKITVEAGTGDEATFERKSYYGEETFVLEANSTKIVPIVCRITNIAVKVVYDATVSAAFDQGFKTYVCASDAFSKEDAENGFVPTLEYTQDKTGFFILPEGVSNLSWGFYGTSSDPAISAKGAKTGVIELPKSGMQYTLTYKYSKDADGYLTIGVQVREYESAHDDNFTFSPQPTLTGNGCDISKVVAYNKAPLSFKVSSINPLSKIDMNVGDGSYNIMTAGQVSGDIASNGIEYLATDQYNGVITLTGTFLDALSGGINELDFSMVDNDNAEGKAEVKVAVPGAFGIVSSDLWLGRATLGAVVTDPQTTNVKIRYRLSSSEEWSEIAAVKGSDGYTYTAEAEGFTADREYVFQLAENSQESGLSCTMATEKGTQLPNAGFEDWNQNGSAWYPYAQGGTEFWGTGNPGATSLGSEYNLTSGSEDIRPGSSGRLSARLETKKPSVMGIGKLAGGNIFVGSFGAVSGMGGYVNMGREFSFNAKPKALRIWYKYTPVGSDKGRVFICLVNMTDGSKTHIVDTNKPDQTTFSPDDEFLYVDKTNPSTLQGNIIAYGDLMMENSVSEWTCVEIPITYREQYNLERPNVLILAATASYRADYFEGEVGCLMFLDDVELVY